MLGERAQPLEILGFAPRSFHVRHGSNQCLHLLEIVAVLVDTPPVARAVLRADQLERRSRALRLVVDVQLEGIDLVAQVLSQGPCDGNLGPYPIAVAAKRSQRAASLARASEPSVDEPVRRRLRRNAAAFQQEFRGKPPKDEVRSGLRDSGVALSHLGQHFEYRPGWRGQGIVLREQLYRILGFRPQAQPGRERE